MKWRSILLVLVSLIASAPVMAHRLDQYLQATTITVAKNRLTLQLRLTPGVAVAPQVLESISATNDDVISEAAQASYSQRVRHDLSLTIDGRALPLRLLSASFPTVASLRAGLGDITLTLEADFPQSAAHRRLTFTNAHQPRIAVYLVNTLVPEDPDIRILAQTRSINQSHYAMEFADNAGGGSSPNTLSQYPAQTGYGALVGTFFYHGVLHILTGYDHLLFACALVLAVTTLWDLVKVVTAFTVAHSITLTLAALHLVHLPERVVEPLIAASIIFVAIQNIFWPRSAGGHIRIAAAFMFGLFHGLGFASGLLDLMHHMPREAMLLAILGFSLGVEAGHQVVLLPLFGILALARHRARGSGPRKQVLSAFQKIGSAAIALAGVSYLGVALFGGLGS